jgi:hypothetical protein
MTSNVETKSPNPSLFASIFSSLNSSATDKVVDSRESVSKSNSELISQNVNPIKRTKSETGVERKKLKKSIVSEYEIVIEIVF